MRLLSLDVVTLFVNGRAVSVLQISHSSLLSVEFAAPKSLSATADEFVPCRNLSLGEPLLLPVGSHATTPSEPEFSLPFSDIFSPQNFPPLRPNTSPRANIAQDSLTASHRVTSTLNHSAWKFFLSDYPDRQFVDTLLHIIDYGANIGFHGDRHQSQSSTNLSSAHEHPDVIVEGASCYTKVEVVRSETYLGTKAKTVSKEY
ncbi:hypothetical protein K435DRAFT_877822 [Dendrothele bispora CBS 962.96]|uniref:Uncharacterized protein n=1 Tax=Dendrothele bispora (strain CBS 962.96) TaxID=1314807 RepID=A0A4S8KPI2_DENBC|nr:hypothetical protein K435DRAFT_877822 [Dendrothele bispora CBS 962.96]